MNDITPFDRVQEFHRSFGQAVGLPMENAHELGLRLNLLTEEFEEVRKATIDVSTELMTDGVISKEKKAALLKELCDLLYVTYGYAVSFGLPINPAFNRVHESNMSKLGADGKPVYRDDGKVLKSDRYWVPKLEGLFE